MNYISHANDFIQDGFNPLPLLQNKAPKLPQGHQFLYNPIDRIPQRFGNCEMIGIACGTVSGGFYCLDFDKHSGQNIGDIFKDFTSNDFIKHLVKIGKISFFSTPSGGFHCYYKHESEHKGSTLARWSDNEVMIEIRGNGQYVATSPSPGYAKLKGVDIEKLDYITWDELESIRNLATSFCQVGSVVNTHTKSDRKWPDKWDDSKIEGKFNNESGELVKSLLIDNGWKKIGTRKTDGVELWQRPGKDQGISATFGSKFNMFYVFTSSALPFGAGTAYTPFNIYTILKFGGDWKKAKDSLKPIIKPEPEVIETHSLFPIEVFPTFIRNYILELNRTLNFHTDFTAAAAMFTIATLNGNKFKLRVKEGWEATTIFWFACVGYPGTIKTHPVKTIIKPLHEIDAISKRNYDGLMKEYNPDAKDKQPKPKFHQMLISDYTIEALHSIHDINKRGIGLYKDELIGFLNDMNKYRKGSDEQFWLESFNNGSQMVNRVSREPIMMNNICINIIGTIQHDVLNKLISETTNNGLLDRFLFTASEAKVYNLTADEISPEFAKSWSQIAQEVNKHFEYLDTNSTEVLTMDKETFKTYQTIDAEYVKMQNSEDVDQGIKNYLSKLKTYVPRFALLLAIMDAVDEGLVIEVTNQHMINAKKVADYFLKTAISVHSSNDTQKDIRDMESVMRGMNRNEKILKLYEKGVKQSELAKYYGISRQAISKIINK